MHNTHSYGGLVTTASMLLKRVSAAADNTLAICMMLGEKSKTPRCSVLIILAAKPSYIPSCVAPPEASWRVGRQTSSRATRRQYEASDRAFGSSLRLVSTPASLLWWPLGSPSRFPTPSTKEARTYFFCAQPAGESVGEKPIEETSQRTRARRSFNGGRERE